MTGTWEVRRSGLRWRRWSITSEHYLPDGSWVMEVIGPMFTRRGAEREARRHG